jgi:hypothetical protein
MSNEQFEILKDELKSVVEIKVDEMLSDKIVDYFKECSSSSQLLIEKVDQMKDSADHYEVIKSFVNILQNMSK